MANNKVQLSNGTVIIDLTSDTVTSASHIKSGLVGHLADGTKATGTLIEKDVKSVTYNLSGGATSSLTTSEVVTNQGYSVKLKAPAGYALSNVTVTMGGVDITSQVYKGDTGGGGTEPNSYTRTEILASQSFTASSSNKRATLTGLSEGLADDSDYIVTFDGTEWLVTCETLWSSNYTIGQAQYFLTTSAFDSTEPFGIIWTSGTTCTIAVGDTSQHTVRIEKLTFDGDPLTLIQKTVTESGTYTAEDDGADGYSSVTVDVPSSGAKVATGTYTPSQTYSTKGNRFLCSLAEIGFTPSRFILELDDMDNETPVSTAVVQSSYELMGTAEHPFRMTIRWTDNSGGLGTSYDEHPWTTQMNYYLYMDGTNVYYRTSNGFTMQAGMTYKWTAYE